MRIQTVAVIGSGVMGRGIAHVLAVSGLQVFLHDTEQRQLDKACAAIARDMNTGIERGKLSAAEKERALQRLKATTDFLEAVQGADFVIEAVPEILDLKLGIFQRLDAQCPSYTIFATNTSTMSPTELGAATKRADRTIAMHFFNPVHKMKLVEVIRGLDTSEETYQITKELAEMMGKATVQVNEFPGFITSRINCLVGNEAMRMLQEGVASAADIDKAVKLGLNYPMGPLELADLVGLDSRLRNMQYLHEKLGETYRPAPILEKYVAAGRLGRKSGKGFYDYNQNQ